MENTNAITAPACRTWTSEYHQKTYFVARARWNDDRQVTRHDFGLNDERGRAIGAIITCGTYEVVPYEGEIGTLSTRPPGTYLYMNPQATRNRAAYGAAQGDHTYATEADRQAAIEKYLEGARKRAAKKAPVPA